MVLALDSFPMIDGEKKFLLDIKIFIHTINFFWLPKKWPKSMWKRFPEVVTMILSL